MRNGFPDARIRLQVILLTLAIVCPALAGQSQTTKPPKPEDAPPGVHFLATAQSLGDLIKQVKPDLHWNDPSYGPILLWLKRPHDGKPWQAAFDCAYHVRQNGRVFWALLDSNSTNGLKFENPVRQFFVLKFVRDTFAIPTKDIPDGNSSHGEILAKRDDGAALLKLVYCSLSGPRALQEGLITSLIYAPPHGKLQLACADAGEDDNTLNDVNFWTDMHVIWNGPHAATPLHLKVTQYEDDYDMIEDDSRQQQLDLEICRDGVLDGPFPMKLKYAQKRYVLIDTPITPKAVVSLLMFYFDLYTPAQRQKVRKRWIEAIKTRNPRTPMDKPLAKGAHLFIPDPYSFEYTISRELTHPKKKTPPSK